MSETAQVESTQETSASFVDSIESVFDGFDNMSDDSSSEMSDSDFSNKTELEPEQVESNEPEAAQSQEPKDALSEFDELDNTKDWTPQAAKRFKDLKSELKTYKTKAEELESNLTAREQRLKELEALTDNTEYDQLRSKIQEYEQQEIVTKLESSRAYKTLVNEPLAKIVSEADSIATKYGVDSDTLLDVIALNDESTQEERLAEILASASDRDKFRVYKLIEDVKPIFKQRQALQENAQAALREAEELESMQQRQNFAEKIQQRQKAANLVSDKLQAKLSFLKDVPDVDFAAIAKDAASTDSSQLDDVTSTYQVFATKLFPKLAKQYVNLQREVDSLTEKLASYDRAAPKTSGGSVNSMTGYAPNDSKSFLDAISTAFGS